MGKENYYNINLYRNNTIVQNNDNDCPIDVKFVDNGKVDEYGNPILTMKIKTYLYATKNQGALQIPAIPTYPHISKNSTQPLNYKDIFDNNRYYSFKGEGTLDEKHDLFYIINDDGTATIPYSGFINPNGTRSHQFGKSINETSLVNRELKEIKAPNQKNYYIHEMSYGDEATEKKPHYDWRSGWSSSGHRINGFVDTSNKECNVYYVRNMNSIDIQTKNCIEKISPDTIKYLFNGITYIYDDKKITTPNACLTDITYDREKDEWVANGYENLAYNLVKKTSLDSKEYWDDWSQCDISLWQIAPEKPSDLNEGNGIINIYEPYNPEQPKPWHVFNRNTVTVKLKKTKEYTSQPDELKDGKFLYEMGINLSHDEKYDKYTESWSDVTDTETPQQSFDAVINCCFCDYITPTGYKKNKLKEKYKKGSDAYCRLRSFISERSGYIYKNVLNRLGQWDFAALTYASPAFWLGTMNITSENNPEHSLYIVGQKIRDRNDKIIQAPSFPTSLYNMKLGDEFSWLIANARNDDNYYEKGFHIKLNPECVKGKKCLIKSTKFITGYLEKTDEIKDTNKNYVRILQNEITQPDTHTLLPDEYYDLLFSDDSMLCEFANADGTIYSYIPEELHKYGGRFAGKRYTDIYGEDGSADGALYIEYMSHLFEKFGYYFKDRIANNALKCKYKALNNARKNIASVIKDDDTKYTLEKLFDGFDFNTLLKKDKIFESKGKKTYEDGSLYFNTFIAPKSDSTTGLIPDFFENTISENVENNFLLPIITKRGYNDIGPDSTSDAETPMHVMCIGSEEPTTFVHKYQYMLVLPVYLEYEVTLTTNYGTKYVDDKNIFINTIDFDFTYYKYWVKEDGSVRKDVGDLFDNTRILENRNGDKKENRKFLVHRINATDEFYYVDGNGKNIGKTLAQLVNNKINVANMFYIEYLVNDETGNYKKAESSGYTITFNGSTLQISFNREWVANKINKLSFITETPKHSMFRVCFNAKIKTRIGRKFSSTANAEINM